MNREELTELTVPRLALRNPESHKGDFGRALLVGGSRGMSGAMGLAGTAALRGGAGLVRLAVPRAIQDIVAGYEPSYMTIGLRDDDEGSIGEAATDNILTLAESATAMALGPGMGRGEEIDRLVARIYREVQIPMVVDADALNALAGRFEVLAAPGGPRVLTPHPGEFARLVASESMDEAAQISRAEKLAADCGIVVVLKGHRTLATDGRRSARNTTGNPGMATGGSGDVLTGLIVALLCQGMQPYDAARMGIFLHGRAGDLAAVDLGQVSTIAADLLSYLSEAFLSLQSS